MRANFLIAALFPHLVFGLCMVGVCKMPRASWGNVGWAVPVTAAQILCWYLTDLVLTDRVPRERMIRESRMYIGLDGRPTRDPEALAWILLGGIFFAVNVFALCVCPGASAIVAGVIVAADLGLLCFALIESDAYSAFVRHVWPRLEAKRQAREYLPERDPGNCPEEEAEERRHCEIQAARREAERFYAAHAALLRDSFPEALFRSTLHSLVPGDCDSRDAWQGARQLIERLQPFVQEAQERRRLERERAARQEARRAQLQAEIARCQAQLARVRTSALDPDVIEDEVQGLNERIRHLREQLAIPDSQHEE